MKFKPILIALSASIIGISLGSVLYKYIYKSKIKQPFTTILPQKKDLQQIVYASGSLRIKDNIKVGSLIAGTIKEIYVEEGDKIKKGKLLAEIDNGKGDTDVKMTEGKLAKAKSKLEYLQNFYDRQKQLYETKQISKDLFEQITKDYTQAKAEVTIAQAELEKYKIEYENAKIIAPEDGIITAVGITKGMRITTDLDATVLFEIAKDITQMETSLDIDESDIGCIEKNQIIKFTVDTYPDRTFKGKIAKISYSSKQKNNLQTYEAIANINNKDKSLRPGMTVNAKITVNKKNNCLTLSNQAFQINPNSLKKIAQMIKYQFQPINKYRKKQLKQEYNGKNQMRFIWITDNHSFLEKAVVVGITDDCRYEIVSGIKSINPIIIDIEEPNEMEKIYKKWFSKGL